MLLKKVTPQLYHPVTALEFDFAQVGGVEVQGQTFTWRNWSVQAIDTIHFPDKAPVICNKYFAVSLRANYT